jgi:hypothetical protein
MKMSEIIRHIKNNIAKTWLCLTAGPKKSLLIYWIAYGGRKALFGSIYFWMALFFSIIITITSSFSNSPWNWQERAIATVPSILGFSLGGYAILVGFGDENFRRRIRGKKDGEKSSLYMRVNAAFFHFIFVQFLCILYTIVTDSLFIGNIFVFRFFGVFFFVYALMTVVATSLAVLNLANWFDMMPKE